MPDPIAMRVATRYLQAIGHSPEALLHDTESAMHRGQELLHAVTQQHGFLEKAIVGEEPFGQVEKLYRKIHPLVSAYEQEIQRAMASLDAWEHAQAEVGVAAGF